MKSKRNLTPMFVGLLTVGTLLLLTFSAVAQQPPGLPSRTSMVDVIQDGGFELGTPNPVWDEFSSNFGTPLCNSSCGTSGQHSGSYWAWFGGINGNETGHLRQSVTIPAGMATLSFWLRIAAASGTGQDLFQILIDGQELFLVTDADQSQYSIYTLVTIDVSTFADGGTHLVSLESTMLGNGITNFFVDDVKLDVTASSNDHLVHLPLVSASGSSSPTETPSPTPEPGPLFATVLGLDGVDDFAASQSSSSALNLGDDEDFTVEAFFYTDNPGPIPAQIDVIVCRWQNFCLFIVRDTGDPDQLILQLWSSANQSQIFTSNLYFMTPGWHHLAATYDRTAQEATIYYDGEREGTFNFVGTVHNVAVPVTVGGLPGGTSLPGHIEEVRLSGTERYTGATYIVPNSPFAADGMTRALWHFDEPAGSTTFSDSSGNNFTAVGLNGAQTVNP